MMKGRPQSSRTTRTSRTTGESASHYRHLEFERSYDEGRALVSVLDADSPVVRLVRVVQLVNLHLIIDT